MGFSFHHEQISPLMEPCIISLTGLETMQSVTECDKANRRSNLRRSESSTWTSQAVWRLKGVVTTNLAKAEGEKNNGDTILIILLITICGDILDR